MTGSAGAIRAGRAFVEAFLDKTKLEEGLKNVKAQLDAFAKQVAIVGGAMSAMGASIVGPMTLAVKHFAAAGDMLDKMSGRTGVAVETLSALEFVASQTGSSIQTLEKGFAGLSRTFFEAKRGGGAAVDALAELGLTFKDLNRLSPDEQFMEIATALEALENESIRGAVAQKIFGRAGRELLPMLNGAKGGIEDLMKKAKELGLVLSQEDAKAAAKMTDAMDVLKRSFDSVKLALGRELIPVALQFVEHLTTIVQHVRQWVTDNKEMAILLGKIAIALTIVGTAMLAFAAAAKAAAAAQAAVLALSGPKGLAILAAGAAALGITVAVLNRKLDGLSKEASSALAASRQAAKGMKEMGEAADFAADRIDKQAEALKRHRAEQQADLDAFDRLEKELARMYPDIQLEADLRAIDDFEKELKKRFGFFFGDQFEGIPELRDLPLFDDLRKEAQARFDEPEKQRLDSIAKILEGLADDLLEPLDRQLKQTTEALKELGATPDEIKKAQDLIAKAFEEMPEEMAKTSFSAEGGTFSQLASQMFSTGGDPLTEAAVKTEKNTRKIEQNTRAGITFKE